MHIFNLTHNFYFGRGIGCWAARLSHINKKQSTHSAHCAFEFSCGYVFSSSAMVKLQFVYIDWQGYNSAMQLDEPSV